jgi:membrane-associated phospholipid phosphatase
MRRVIVSALGLALCTIAAAQKSANEKAADVLRIAMPAGVAAYELWLRDGEGLLQFGASFAVTTGTTEVLKRTTHVERPDHSDDMSFPSGHAASTFAAATFMHRRHGLESAWPWYVAATWVGWTRVDANRHRWGDVIGGAAIAATSTWLLVTTKPGAQVVVVPAFGTRYVGAVVHASW